MGELFCAVMHYSAIFLLFQIILVNVLCTSEVIQEYTSLNSFFSKNYFNSELLIEKNDNNIFLCKDMKIDGTIDVFNLHKNIIGNDNIRLESIGKREKREMFNLRNSSLSLSNMKIKVFNSEYIASVNIFGYLKFLNIEIESDLSIGNTIKINGGSVKMYNISISSQKKINSFVDFGDLGGDFIFENSNLNSNILGGNMPLFFCKNSIVSECKVFNLTTEPLFYNKYNKEKISEKTHLFGNTFVNCEGVNDGVLFSIDRTNHFISSNNTFHRTNTVYRNHQRIADDSSYKSTNDIYVECYSDKESGGALYYSGYVLELNNCTFKGCSSKLSGGAVYFTISSFSPNTVTIDSCNFTECRAYSDGGAIVASDGHIRISNSSFKSCHGSSRYSNGGALFIENSGTLLNSLIINCFFYNGSAELGGGIDIKAISEDFSIKEGTFTSCHSDRGGSLAVGDISNPLTLTSCAFCSSYAELSGDDVFSIIWDDNFQSSSFSNCYSTIKKNSVYDSKDHTSLTIFTYDSDPTDYVGCDLPGSKGPGKPYKKHDSEEKYIASVVVTVVVVIIIVILAMCCVRRMLRRRRRRRRKEYAAERNPLMNTSQNISYISEPPSNNMTQSSLQSSSPSSPSSSLDNTSINAQNNTYQQQSQVYTQNTYPAAQSSANYGTMRGGIEGSGNGVDNTVPIGFYQPAVIAANTNNNNNNNRSVSVNASLKGEISIPDQSSSLQVSSVPIQTNGINVSQGNGEGYGSYSNQGRYYNSSLPSQQREGGYYTQPVGYESQTLNDGGVEEYIPSSSSSSSTVPSSDASLPPHELPSSDEIKG